jgi:DNA-binding transcriptional MerR regulator
MAEEKKVNLLSSSQLYFRIGEVAEFLGVATSVLRYWEEVFPQLHPEKSKTNLRQYDKKTVELLVLIHRLLHKERFTIEGAKKVLAGLEGNWKRGIEALDAGTLLAPSDSAAPASGAEAMAQELDEMRKQLSGATRQLERKDQELRDYQARYKKLEKELISRKTLFSQSVLTAVETELKALLLLAEEPADTGPAMRPDSQETV